MDLNAREYTGIELFNLAMDLGFKTNTSDDTQGLYAIKEWLFNQHHMHITILFSPNEDFNNRFNFMVERIDLLEQNVEDENGSFISGLGNFGELGYNNPQLALKSAIVEILTKLF